MTKVELHTCLYEVATSINSRPLTYVGTDIENKPAFSPNHFLSGHGNQCLEFSVIEDAENASVELLDLSHQELLQSQDDFWRVCSSDYLRNCLLDFKSFGTKVNVEVGSVVLIKEDNMPGMKWMIGLFRIFIVVLMVSQGLLVSKQQV